MKKYASNYQSFLVRLWHEKSPEGSWRVMVEEIGEAGSRHYFKDLESLVGYFSERTPDRPGKEEGPL